jgi:uncharacterized repeat protein (TIGR03837 family)
MRAVWDLFCSVIDNFGDVGVSWRLARTLAHDHGIPVRLWVDDLGTLARLDPGADPAADAQMRAGVEVRAWREPFPAIEPGEVVIEAFGCRLPEPYVRAMAERERPPVWINLEYLSAEEWVRGCHGLPSPHPRLPLRKHFFFPGFGAGTGGLLRERDLSVARANFQDTAAPRAAHWAALGLPPVSGDELRCSLFCYENEAVPSLLDAWSRDAAPVRCVVPEGRIVDAVARHFAASSVAPGARFERGSLAVHVVPFVDQPSYDRLLWACDFNFVRGEDSFVRAQWAARPFVWHIYPQAAGAHQAKLGAFLDRYCALLPEAAAAAVREFHRGWNGAPALVADAWNRWRECMPALQAHARTWALTLEAGPELTAELVKFAQGQVK